MKGTTDLHYGKCRIQCFSHLSHSFWPFFVSFNSHNSHSLCKSINSLFDSKEKRIVLISWIKK